MAVSFCVAVSFCAAVLTPEEFALNLIREAMTTDRVAAVIARIAGDRIEVGPLRMGPGGAVAARGVGIIGPIEVTTARGMTLGFEANIPGELTIDLTAGSTGRPHHYEGSVIVPLRIAVVLEAPALVVLDVTALRPSDVAVQLHTTGVATFVLQTLGDADSEVAGQVATVVNDRVAAVADLCRINLVDLLDRSWDAEFDARLARCEISGSGRSVDRAVRLTGP